MPLPPPERRAEGVTKQGVWGAQPSTQDSGIYSSYEPVRRSQGAERLLGWSPFNRCHTFNLFGDNLKRGDTLYYVAKETDLSDSQHFVDPLGQPIVSRTSYPATALQIHGWSSNNAPFPMHNTSYAPENFKNPQDGDADYIRREHQMTQEWREHVWVEKEDHPDGGEFQEKPREPDFQELLNSLPTLYYDANMIGTVKRLGLARHTEGRSPTPQQIRDGHRSQNAMKMLQTVEIYRGL